ncbi:hypothetical protein DW228_06535 [Bacteroides fragilis]|uniref:Uncharacterized protein n=1 Tax=Bacteroides fragilis TaxID=817 RepID=A0A396C6Y1_BACFG|nr:hypothetical protein [Bacteroides fragilis]RHH14454.1 hypothetical protein DW228_06535 [Bacteroides fragilis]
MIKTIYRLPAHWACPLINDDYSGTDDIEKEEIRKFMEKAEGRPVSVDFTTEGFSHYNDAGTLPGNCADFIFIKD